VFMNGLLLDLTVDYTSNGSAVTLTSGAAAGDEIEVVAYNTFSVGDAIPASGGTFTGNVTHSGDVAINGTLTSTSTGTTLSSNSYNVVKIQTDKDDNGSNDDGILQFTTGSSNTVKGELRYDESESMFEIGHGDNQGHVRINSSGHVTKPNQPSFSAYMSQSNPTITSNPTKIPYSATRWNVGSHFDTSNNRFVAPIAGKYCFQVNHNVYGLSDDQYFRTRVYVNGSSYQILGYMRARGGGDHTTNDSFLLDMSANDYVEIYTSSADTSYSLSAALGWNSFSGFLIG